MTSQIVWLAYTALAFIAMPLMFRLRFGRWPFAYRLPPRDLYGWIDLAYGAVVIAFTACVLMEPRSGHWLGPGLALAVSSGALIVWAIVAMGPSWRFGQDEPTADRCERTDLVRSGPFRFVRHPIYVGLFGLAAGMTLMRGGDWCAVVFLALTTGYVIRQAWAESRYWTRRLAAGVSC